MNCKDQEVMGHRDIDNNACSHSENMLELNHRTLFQREKLRRPLWLLVASSVLLITLFNALPAYRKPLDLQPLLIERLAVINKQMTTKHSRRYITNCFRFFAGRLGNQLFKLAAVLYIADTTGRRPVLTKYVDVHAENYYFDRWFDVEPTVAVIKNVSEKNHATWSRGSFADVSSFTGKDLGFDERWVQAIKNRSTSGHDLHDVTTLRLCAGYFMSWRYVEPISGLLRRLLRPKPEVVNSVQHFFQSVRPRNWTNYWRIGIHVRAGDVRENLNQQVGFTVPTRLYFERALRQIVYTRCGKVDLCKQRQKLQLFVATNEFRWTNLNINITAIVLDLVADDTWWSSNGRSHTHLNVEFDVVHSRGHDAGFDLVALSVCDVVVTSTGSYGWWAGWLSEKTVFYFKNWPKPGMNHLNSVFNRYDYFPPSWIGIDAPFFDFSKT